MGFPKNLLISRTDSVGDMVLTLPMVTVLKQAFPDRMVGILGAEYTRSVVEACSSVDAFISRDDFLRNEVTLKGQAVECIIHVKPEPEIAKRAKQLGIPSRIGTVNRWFHWLTCNRFVRLSRSKSTLHEAQLNLVLLKAFGINRSFPLSEIADLYALQKLTPLPEIHANLLQADKFKLILHPKSRGSAREWGLENFAALINALDPDKFQIFISGTQNEQPDLRPLFGMIDKPVMDISGQMNLAEFMAFIAACDGLVACSTGPIHIAAALHKHALGLYPPIRPLDPGRWGAIGTHARIFVLDKECNACRKDSSACVCMQAIQPMQIKEVLDRLVRQA